MDTMASDKVVRRRRYGVELKARVVAECEAPGASVAKVAMAHGINANIVHRWLREHAGTALVVQAPNEFVALTVDETAMPSAIAQPKPDIRVEVRRGNSAIVVSWPVQEASSCAAWLREWLK